MKKETGFVKIVFEDESIIAVIKPSGLAAQSLRGFEPDMESELKNYLSVKSKSVNPYLGIIHRLDKPVSGIMLFAKTKKAAAGLGAQMAGREFKKKYSAAVYGKPDSDLAVYEDYIKKESASNISYICRQGTNAAKKAVMSYTLKKSIIYRDIKLSLLDIELFTGRHHQIRLQLSYHKLPIIGDRKYGITKSGIGGLKTNKVSKDIAELESFNTALICTGLAFKHPVSGKHMEFGCEPEGYIWSLFAF